MAAIRAHPLGAPGDDTHGECLGCGDLTMKNVRMRSTRPESNYGESRPCACAEADDLRAQQSKAHGWLACLVTDR